MKYLLLLLAVVSLPACGQTTSSGHPSFGPATPTLESGKRVCDPAQDKDPEDDWGVFHKDADGYLDPRSLKVYDCDFASRKWKLDPELTKNEIADTAKDIADSKAKDNHRKMLEKAVISRILTEKEMAEVVGLGTGIFADPFDVCGGATSCSYSGDYRTMADAHELYLSRKFNDALLQQFKLRAIAAEHAGLTFRSLNPCNLPPNSAAGCIIMEDAGAGTVTVTPSVHVCAIEDTRPDAPGVWRDVPPDSYLASDDSCASHFAWVRAAKP